MTDKKLVLMAKLLKLHAEIVSGHYAYRTPDTTIDGYRLSEQAQLEPGFEEMDDLIRELSIREHPITLRSGEEIELEPSTDEQLEELGL